MTNPKAPARIWARIHGGGVSHPSGESYVQGGWEDRPRDNAAEYIRADLVADAVEALGKVSRSLGAEISLHRCACPAPCEDYFIHPGPCGTRRCEAYHNIKVVADAALARIGGAS